MASGEWGRRLGRLGWVVSLLALSATALDAGTRPPPSEGGQGRAWIVTAERTTRLPAGRDARSVEAPASAPHAFESVGHADR